MNKKVKFSICKTECEYGEMYEYRGALSCENCFDELQTKRDAERQQIIENLSEVKHGRIENL